MLAKSVILAILPAVSPAVAFAGPCSTTGRDAGSGPVTTGKANETTGVASTNAKEHPPTSAMNKASENTTTSSQDAQRQMQGQPTAAGEAKSAAKRDDKGCQSPRIESRYGPTSAAPTFPHQALHFALPYTRLH